jgi:hypothetical protein
MSQFIPPSNLPDEKPKRVPVNWSDAEDAKYLELLLEQLEDGLQAENGWKRQTWVKVLTGLQAALPQAKDKTIDKLKSRHDRVSLFYYLFNYYLPLCNFSR